MKNGMLITDDEIIAQHTFDAADAETILAALDADPTTAKYEPIFGGKRFRPAVEKWLQTNEAAIAFVQRLRAEHRTKAAG